MTKFTLLFFMILAISVVNGQELVDITNLGGTISAQYTDSPAGEDITKVIDNSSATKYLTFHSSGWIQFQAFGLYVVSEYSITSANDAETRNLHANLPSGALFRPVSTPTHNTRVWTPYDRDPSPPRECLWGAENLHDRGHTHFWSNTGYIETSIQAGEYATPLSLS